MSLEQLPSEILRQVSLSLDRHAVWALCLTSAQFHRDFQPSLITAKGSLDRAYKWSAEHGDVALFRQVLKRGKYRNLSALCLAAKHGHMDIVDELLLDYEDMREALLTGGKTENKSWGHPLATAIKAGHVHVVNRLLDLEGMDINRVNSQYWYKTPLERAAWSRDPRMLQNFIQRNVSLRDGIGIPIGSFPIITAFLHRNHEAIDVLHKNGGAKDIPLQAWMETSDQLGSFQDTRLRKQLYEVVPELATDPEHLLSVIDLGPQVLRKVLETVSDISNPSFYFSLPHVIRMGDDKFTVEERIEMCELLVQHGVTTDIISDSNESPQYDLAEWAVVAKVPMQLLEYILSIPGCPLPSRALSRTKDTTLAKYLLDKGADVHASFDVDECQTLEYTTPLLAVLEGGPSASWKPATETARQDWLAMIRLLVKHGADPSFVSLSGKNALDCAAQSGSVDEDLLQWLMDRGAKVTVSQDEYPRFWHPVDGLHLTDRGKSYRVAKWLLERGASASSSRGSRSDAITSAVCHLNVELLELLLAYGADVRRCDDEYWTLLYEANNGYKRDDILPCETRNKDNELAGITRLLLNAGARMFRDDSRENNIILPIVSGKHLQAYLDNGMQLNQTLGWEPEKWCPPGTSIHDTQYGTILHYAAQKHDVNFVKYVLDAGASRLATNPYGQTPWKVAVRMFGSRLVEGKPDPILEEYRAIGLCPENEQGLKRKRDSQDSQI